MDGSETGSSCAARKLKHNQIVWFFYQSLLIAAVIFCAMSQVKGVIKTLLTADSNQQHVASPKQL